MVNPMEVDMEPGQEDHITIKKVVVYVLAKVASQHPRLRDFERSVR